MSRRGDCTFCGITAGILAIIAIACPVMASQAQVTVVFRCDDYSSTSDTGFEIRLIDLFRKHQLPITLAVVPYVTLGSTHDPSARPDAVSPLSRDKAGILKSAMADGTVELALHGYSHQTRMIRRWTEFRGMDPAEQRRRITAGRDLLEQMLGSRVRIFAPPWNRSDANTVRVLEEEGFDILSADCYDAAVVSGKLAYVPATAALGNAREAVRAAVEGSEPSPIVVVLLHNFEFRDATKHQGGPHTLAEVDELLGWMKSQPHVRVTTIAEAAGRTRALPPERLLTVHEFLVGTELRLLPQQLAPRFRLLAYPVAQRDLQSMKARLWVTLLAFWGSVLAVVAGTTCLVVHGWRLRLLTTRWLLFVIAASAGVLASTYLLTPSSGRLFHAVMLAACLGCAHVTGLVVSRRHAGLASTDRADRVMEAV